MQSRLASDDLALTTGIIAGAVTLAAGADAAPPDWIKLTPRGRAATRDGRSFTFDPAVLAARFDADGIDIPLDTDHSTVLLGSQGKKPNTIGYVTAVEARDDGTHGRVNWLDAGKAVLQARTHRFVSPTIHHDSAGNVTWLHSAALVSAPALTMPAILHALEGPPMKQIAKALGLPETAPEADCLAALAARTELKPLAAALGLPETADPAACLAAIGTLRQDKGGLVEQLQTNLAATTARLATVEKAGRDKDVATLLEEALKARKIVPAQREHYAALCSTDDGLKNVRAMLAATPEGLQSSGLDGRPPENGDAQDPAALAAEARKLVAERTAAGSPIGIAEAVTLIANRKK